MKYLKILAVALLAIGLASCCSCRKGKNVNALPLTGTEWQLVQLDGRTFDAKNDSYTLNLSSDNKATGRGDCNRIAGVYEASDKGALKFGALAGTRMFCPDQESENAYLKLLQSTTSYTIDGKMLMLLTDGNVKLVFAQKKQ